MRLRPSRKASALVAALGIAWAALAGPAAPASTPASAPADLASAFAHAVEAVRRHQSAAGSWPTAVTLGPAFENPTAEVNVFTPAVLIDLLDPIARDAGLTPQVERARDYLRGQIETTGLVRYHGDPGPVPPEHRGCELPPDADDTALVWRIAPRSEPDLLARARREIERYGDGDGLYRTWLASDAEYRCFYVRYAGREWNPPDIAVEMHVYLFLAERDAAAAERLCRALGRRIDEERIWAWYTVAPVLPLLREIDLAAKGCPLRVPPRWADRAVAGQAAYLEQARLLRRLILGEAPEGGLAALREASLRALRGGAAETFAALSRTPPLLYHNDLSAAPPHFHWSPEVGYALWLRLYVETARRFPGVLAVPPARG